MSTSCDGALACARDGSKPSALAAHAHMLNALLVCTRAGTREPMNKCNNMVDEQRCVLAKTQLGRVPRLTCTCTCVQQHDMYMYM